MPWHWGRRPSVPRHRSCVRRSFWTFLFCWMFDPSGFGLPDGKGIVADARQDGDGIHPGAGDAPRPDVFVEEVCADKGAAGIAEIGRASCKARVCQYVEISVVAVMFKQKKSTPKTTQ